MPCRECRISALQLSLSYFYNMQIVCYALILTCLGISEWSSCLQASRTGDSSWP